MAQVSISDAAVVANGREDIAQSLYLVLATQKGSDPLRPAFGSNLYKYLDKPLAQVKTLIVLEASNAIRQWERRVVVKKIQAEQGSDAALTLYITAELVSDGTISDYTITI